MRKDGGLRRAGDVARAQSCGLVSAQPRCLRERPQHRPLRGQQLTRDNLARDSAARQLAGEWPQRRQSLQKAEAGLDQAERSLGGNVHHVGPEGVEEAGDRAELRHGEPDGRVRRKRRGWNAQLVRARGAVARVPRCDDSDVMAEVTEYLGDPRDDCRDAVDLRRVRV